VYDVGSAGCLRFAGWNYQAYRERPERIDPIRCSVERCDPAKLDARKQLQFPAHLPFRV